LGQGGVSERAARSHHDSGYVMCSAWTRSWFYMLLIATTMSVTLFVILDLEYPRFGLIRIDAADQVLIELRGLMR
jgi:hypothetical protein